MALCHLGYEEETKKIITNLVTLNNEKFGQKTTKWFTQEAVEVAMIQVYDRFTNTIEVGKKKFNAATELFASFNNHATETA